MFQTLILIGNLGKEPEMRFTPSGQPVTTLSVATNRRYSGANGQPVKEIHDLNLALGRIPNREMGLLGIRRQGRALVLPLGPRPQVGTTSTTAPGQPRSTTDD